MNANDEIEILEPERTKNLTKAIFQKWAIYVAKINDFFEYIIDPLDDPTDEQLMKAWNIWASKQYTEYLRDSLEKEVDPIDFDRLTEWLDKVMDDQFGYDKWILLW